MKNVILIILTIGIVQLLSAQEVEEWKAQTFVTGYFTINGEYINNLPVFKEVKGFDKAVGIGEASILSTIKPLEYLKINSVLTYKPRLELNEIITELSGEWQFSDAFSVKAGRFLLPLHPANSQYYAPMNLGVALPIFVTNHSLFPLNMDGLNLNGDISLGESLSLGYNFSGGQYSKMSRTEAGLLGFFGRDGVYLNDNAQQVNTKITAIDYSQTGVYPKYFGTGGNLNLKFNNVIQLGFSAFYSEEEASKKPNPETYFETTTKFLSYGTNFLLNYNKLNIKASAWYGNESPKDLQHFEEYNIELYYGEIAYTLNKITPYAKVEIINGRSKNWKRASFGVNYRPFFEITFKLEYHRYFQDYVDDFDVFQVSAIYSF